MSIGLPRHPSTARSRFKEYNSTGARSYQPRQQTLDERNGGSGYRVAGRGLLLPDLTKALEGPGHLEVKDGKIEGVNLMGEAIVLLKIAGISLDQAKATAFSTIETDFMIKQGIVNVQKLLDGQSRFSGDRQWDGRVRSNARISP